MKKNKFVALIILFLLVNICLLPSYVQANSDIIIMLDPGHGGADPGAVGGGMIESDLNWKIAVKVKEILDITPGITGILTRGENENVSIQTRGEKARDNNADLLVSFHINSSEVPRASGAEVYITANTRKKRYHEYSKVLGRDILRNLNNIGVKSNYYDPMIKFSTDGELYEDGFLSDWYGIIRNPMYYGIPGMIIEHAYINNPYDRENYLNDSMIEKMAQADADAIIANKELFRKNYIGDLSTDIQNINFYKDEYERSYISGEILVSEWIDGVTWSIPESIPKIRLKAIDESESCEMSVRVIEGNKYYFEGCIEGINSKKKYKIEVESGSTDNISKYRKVQSVYNKNETFGQYRRDILEIRDNVLIFTPTNYYGDIATDVIDTTLNKDINGYYLSGRILVSEWIGKLWTEPDINPQIEIVSTDNEYRQVLETVKEHGNQYYFKEYVDKLDLSKEYIIKTKLMNNYNLSNKKEAILSYKNNTELGKMRRL